MRKIALTKYSLITVYHFKSKFTSYFLYTSKSIFLKWLDEVWTDQAPLVYCLKFNLPKRSKIYEIRQILFSIVQVGVYIYCSYSEVNEFNM